MTEKPRVVFLEKSGFTVDITDRDISHVCDWVEYGATEPGEVKARLTGATAAMSVGLSLGVEELAGLDGLRFLSVCSTGIDHVDLEFCAARGIQVRGVAGYAATAVAEHAIALLLALKRNLPGFLRDVQAGLWQQSPQYCLASHPVEDLQGLRLGLIGCGEIGSTVARLAGAFGMQVVRAGRKGEAKPAAGRVPFETVLRTSDVISLHCPLTDETRGLFGAAEFTAMERRPVLINTARGGLIDEAALVRAIEAGQISAAGLDVVSAEPIRNDNPLLKLVGDPRLLLTPHVAWSSRQAQQALYDKGVANIENFLCGQGSN